MKKVECYPVFFQAFFNKREIISFNQFINIIKTNTKIGFEIEELNNKVIIICFSNSSFNEMNKVLSEGAFMKKFTTHKIEEMIWG